MAQKIYAWTFPIEQDVGITWTVPSDWNSTNNKIEVIGRGGSGFAGGQKGGGGGAYAKISNFSVTPGSTIYIGATFEAGSYTYFTTKSNGLPSNVSEGVSAEGATLGSGGTASASVGDVKYSGGSGGDNYIPELGSAQGGGGGGAAGPAGAGKNGGNANSTGPAGGGGGGAGGGSSTAGSNAAANDNGDGGQGPDGTGGGTSSTSATKGGGGVGKVTGTLAGAGGNGEDLGTVTHTSGSAYSISVGTKVGAGGGGGGGYSAQGGAGGLYGGGAGTPGSGVASLVVVTYDSLGPDPSPLVRNMFMMF